MDIQKIRDFMEMELKAAESKADSGRKCLSLLLMADELLRHVQEETDASWEEDADLLKTAFLRCGSIGERIRGFCDQHQKSLSVLSARTQERIEGNTERIMESRIKAKELDAILQEAEKKESEFRDKNQEIIRKVQELKEREDRYSALQKEIARYREMSDDMAELACRIVEAEKEYGELKAYLEANDRLEKNILEEGCYDKNSFRERLSEIKKKAEALTAEYDRMLGAVLKDAKELQERIRARRMPGRK